MSLDDLKRRILTRVPLEALMSEHGVALKNQSGHWVGKCCFHADSTPSLHVYPDNHYHCFGCKAHGDAITFVRETQGLGYVEGLRYLAGRFGIEAAELDQPRTASREAPLYRILQEAQEFFVANLWSPHGDEARTYLHGRGYDDESIKTYGFGLTPPEGFGLVRHLRGKGYREADMITASVATAATDSKRTYDFFRNRLMIPIHDPQGRLIAYGGRTMDGHSAKYVNSRETPLFQKSQTLYGLDKARAAMRQRGRAIVVEGYMDALMLRRHGFAETVGILGTALNVEHLRMLERSTSLCYLLLDADLAGQTTTLETVTLALAVPRLEIRAVRLPDAKQDPDEFVREKGGEGLEELLRQSRDLFAFAIAERFRNTPSLAVPELVLNEFVPWLAHVADPLKCEILAARISQLTGVAVDRILPSVRDARRALAQAARSASSSVQSRATQSSSPLPPASAPHPPPAAPLRPLPRADVEIFGHIFHAEPAEIDVDGLEREAVRLLELDLPYQDFLAEMLAALRRGVSPASLTVAEYQSTTIPEVGAVIERLIVEGKRFAGTGRAERLHKVFDEKRRLRLKGELARMTSQLARLQMLGDSQNDEEIQQILRAIADMRRRIDRPSA
jgi:DNA primase